MILEITAVLFAALLGTLILSLYPAFKIARASILKIMN
jgi:ABC-type lipoprotein release transport system permease subunit